MVDIQFSVYRDFKMDVINLVIKVSMHVVAATPVTAKALEKPAVEVMNEFKTVQEQKYLISLPLDDVYDAMVKSGTGWNQHETDSSIAARLFYKIVVDKFGPVEGGDYIIHEYKKVYGSLFNVGLNKIADYYEDNDDWKFQLKTKAKFHDGGIVGGESKYLTYKTAAGHSSIAQIANTLPGVMEEVPHPAKLSPEERCQWEGDPESDFLTKHKVRIKTLIMHLNDSHKWTREQIADWLETLDVDLSFKTKENEDEQGN